MRCCRCCSDGDGGPDAQGTKPNHCATSSDRRRVHATGASRIRNAKDPSAFRFSSFTCDAAPVIHIITTTHLFPSTSLDGAVCLTRRQLKTWHSYSVAVQHDLRTRAASALTILPVSRTPERLPRYLPAADHEDITRSEQEALKGEKSVAESRRVESWLRLADRKSFGS